MTPPPADPFPPASPSPASRHGSYYDCLGLPPSASVQQIRQAYRHLSRQYHPDTTHLPAAIAIEKFKQLNEAYATLSQPEQRYRYDLKMGYARLAIVNPTAPRELHPPSRSPQPPVSSSAYLDPNDRPLSAGEIFVLFMLLLTFGGCLVLAIIIALTRDPSHPIPLPPALLTVQFPI